MFNFLKKKKKKKKPLPFITPYRSKELTYIKLPNCLPCKCGCTKIKSVSSRVRKYPEGVYAHREYFTHHLVKCFCPNCGYTLPVNKTISDWNEEIWNAHMLSLVIPSHCVCGGELKQYMYPRVNPRVHHPHCIKCSKCSFSVDREQGITLWESWMDLKESRTVVFYLWGEKVVARQYYLDLLIKAFKNGTKQLVSIYNNGNIVTLNPCNIRTVRQEGKVYKID